MIAKWDELEANGRQLVVDIDWKRQSHRPVRRRQTLTESEIQCLRQTQSAIHRVFGHSGNDLLENQ